MGVKQPFDFDWSQVEFGVMKLTDMTPNPDNPRTITADQLSTLRKSLTDSPRNLLLNPIKIDSNNVILGGNQRHTGLLELGYIKAPFIKAGPKFTQDEIRQFIVMDNVPAGAWNIPTLSNLYEWEELNEWGVDIENWQESNYENFDEADLVGEMKDNKPTIKITFANVNEMKKAVEEISLILETKYPTAYYSINAGEV